jgi:hypothetical protein
MNLQAGIFKEDFATASQGNVSEGEHRYGESSSVVLADNTETGRVLKRLRSPYPLLRPNQCDPANSRQVQETAQEFELPGRKQGAADTMVGIEPKPGSPHVCLSRDNR